LEYRQSAGQHEVFYDVLRNVAIIFVLFNHRECFRYCFRYQSPCLQSIVTMALAALCKCGPPLFFMISGALLLGKKESFKRIFEHRILRMLVVMLSLTAIQIPVSHLTPAKSFGVFLHGLNWYLYAYLGYLLMLPFIRRMVQNLTIRDRRLFFTMTAAFYSAAGICASFGIEPKMIMDVPLLASSPASNCWQIIFPILGYILLQEINDAEDNRNKPAIDINMILRWGSLISIICVVLFSYHYMNATGKNYLEEIWQYSILFPSCYIFSLCCRSCRKHNNFSTHKVLLRVLAESAGAAFGIFLIETNFPFSKMIFYNIALRIPAPSRYLASIYSVILEFTIYGSFVYLLRRIKPVRKIL